MCGVIAPMRSPVRVSVEPQFTAAEHWRLRLWSPREVELNRWSCRVRWGAVAKDGLRHSGEPVGVVEPRVDGTDDVLPRRNAVGEECLQQRVAVGAPRLPAASVARCGARSGSASAAATRCGCPGPRPFGGCGPSGAADTRFGFGRCAGDAVGLASVRAECCRARERSAALGAFELLFACRLCARACHSNLRRLRPGRRERTRTSSAGCISRVCVDNIRQKRSSRAGFDSLERDAHRRAPSSP
jgi:hypothetical protein